MSQPFIIDMTAAHSMTIKFTNIQEIDNSINGRKFPDMEANFKYNPNNQKWEMTETGYEYSPNMTIKSESTYKDGNGETVEFQYHIEVF